MSEELLTVLKFCFLALLYLFLFRVVRVVVLELRAPAADAPPAAGRGAGRVAAPPRRRDKRAEGRALRLRLLEPAGRKGETYPVAGEVTVGRGGGCAIVLADDTFVSSVHARVYPGDGRTYVEDLGSTNGTFVNGKRVGTATRLRRGDKVQFGQTVAEVVR
jgi:hypothetical protein